MMGSFSFVTGYQHFQSGTLMPVGEKGSIPLLALPKMAVRLLNILNARFSIWF